MVLFFFLFKLEADVNGFENLRGVIFFRGFGLNFKVGVFILFR